MERKYFGKKLFELRNKKNVSQQKLATISSYTQTYISLIETNRANPSKRCQKTLLDSLEKN